LRARVRVAHTGKLGEAPAKDLGATVQEYAAWYAVHGQPEDTLPEPFQGHEGYHVVKGRMRCANIINLAPGHRLIIFPSPYQQGLYEYYVATDITTFAWPTLKDGSGADLTMTWAGYSNYNAPQVWGPYYQWGVYAGAIVGRDVRKNDGQAASDEVTDGNSTSAMTKLLGGEMSVRVNVPFGGSAIFSCYGPDSDPYALGTHRRRIELEQTAAGTPISAYTSHQPEPHELWEYNKDGLAALLNQPQYVCLGASQNSVASMHLRMYDKTKGFRTLNSFGGSAVSLGDRPLVSPNLNPYVRAAECRGAYFISNSSADTTCVVEVNAWAAFATSTDNPALFPFAQPAVPFLTMPKNVAHFPLEGNASSRGNQTVAGKTVHGRTTVKTDEVDHNRQAAAVRVSSGYDQKSSVQDQMDHPVPVGEFALAKAEGALDSIGGLAGKLIGAVGDHSGEIVDKLFAKFF